MIWLPLLALIIICTIFILWPLQGHSFSGAGETSEIDILKDQLQQLDADKEADRIDEAVYASTKLEIKRRILSAVSESQAVKTESGFGLMTAGTGVAFIFAGILYVWIGVPDAPLPDVAKGGMDAFEEETADGPSLENLLDDLQTHLRTNPDNLEGWLLLGQTLAESGQLARAGNAYAEAAQYFTEDANLRVLQGEIMVRQAEGVVTPAARLAFVLAAQMEPQHPAVLYYAGLWQLQNGNASVAIELWQTLWEATSEDAPWRTRLDAQIARAEAMLENNGTPVSDDFAMLQNMTAAEQRTFIEGMIMNLRGRLEANPDDLEGWLRLARSERVMGRINLAIEALVRAKALAEPALSEQIDTELEELRSLQ